ncbi:MAG: hypothetical protein AB7K09_04365 [Planctomycetota bacterium]
MPDNPYRSAGEVLATLPGTAELLKAIKEPWSVASAGESADNAGISSEAALQNPIVNLIRRTGVALADRSRNERRILAVVLVLVALIAGASAWLGTHTPLLAGVGVVVAIGIVGWIYYFPPPAMVIDSRGIWIVRRLRTDFCEWVALLEAEVKELVPGKPQVTITLKGPEHAQHDRHVFSGRLRRPDTQKFKLADKTEMKAPGARHGAFEPYDKGGVAGLGMSPAFDRTQLAMVLAICIRAFGTPDDVVVPRRVTEKIFVDPKEFDSPPSERRPVTRLDEVKDAAAEAENG